MASRSVFRLLALLHCGALAGAQAPCSEEVLLHELSSGTTGPALRTPDGAPVRGGPFSIRIEDALPNMPGALVWSNVEAPFFDPTYMATFHFGVPFNTIFFTTDSEGNSPPQVVVSSLPSAFCGAFLVFQAGVFDRSAPNGVAVTDAIRLRVGENRGQLFPNGSVQAASPTSVDAGDFDGDGQIDLAFSNVDTSAPSLSTVGVALGRADGGFTTSTLAMPGARTVAVEDVDGNGTPDIIGTTLETNEVWSFLGNGDGSFAHVAANHRTPVGLDAVLLIAPDLDGDGNRDAVVGGNLVGNLSIAAGNGDGSFGAPTTHLTGVAPKGLEAGDLDGDSVLDVVVACKSNTVEILFGDGAGGVASTSTIASVGRPEGVALADLDEDGALDLLVAHYNWNVLRVWPGGGDGTFGTSTDYAIGGQPLAIDVSDLDDDGDLDAVTANRLTGDVSVLLGNGDGTLGAAVEYPVGVIVRDVVLADVDPDGIPDIVTANINASSPGEGDIRVTPGRGDGTFVSTTSVVAELGNDWQLEVGDMDGDGVSDLLTVNDLTLVTYFGDGSGSLTKGPVVASSSSIYDAAVGDLDGDGKDDAVFVSLFAAEVGVGLGIGDGTFQPFVLHDAAPSASFPRATGLTLADLDADGALDVIVAVRDDIPLSPDPVSLHLFFGNGTGDLASPPSVLPIDPGLLPTTNARANPVTADFDGDGILDLAAVYGNGDDGALFLGAGGGGFGAGIPITYPESVSFRGPVGASDLDGDGAAELVYWEVVLLGGSTPSYRFGVLGGTDLGTSLYESAVSRLRADHLADVNGDGVPDALLTSATWPEIGVALGTGNGMFEPKMDFNSNLDGNHHDVAAIDLDLDGILDIVDLSTSIGGSLVLLPNLTGE